MPWNRLLTSTRGRASLRSDADSRAEFERDYDRLAFCSAFRRLQDKAQVFPLNRGDFVRTRLTHSMEVSTLGRSFGTQIGLWLRDRGELPASREPHDLGTIVAAACLAHDLGNPPFGHHGENVIGSWFERWFSEDTRGKELAASFTPAQRADFERFEGNAQGLRILVRLQSFHKPWGLNLTHATHGAVIKYPWTSDRTGTGTPPKSKYNVFHSEQEEFGAIEECLGLQGQRHPLVFLTEAADDVCYSAIDIEDGLRRGVVHIPMLVEKLAQLDAELDGRPAAEVLDELFQQHRRSGLSDDEAAKGAIQMFRVRSIGFMAQAAVDAYKQEYDAIMNGDLAKDLVERSEGASLLRALKTIGYKHIYCCEDVRELEVVGEYVICELLDMFVPAVFAGNRDRRARMVSPSLRNMAFLGHEDPDPYLRLRLVVDYISGMTDRYARNTLRRLRGL